MQKNNLSQVTPSQQSWHHPQTDDEIDLRLLIVELMRNKLLIFGVTMLFAISGVAYTFLAPQVWSSKAVINGPLKEDTLPLRQISGQINMLGLGGIPKDKNLFGEFISEFNKRDNQLSFLRQTVYFKKIVAEKQLDAQGQRSWLNNWSKLIKAEPLAKPKEEQPKPGYELVVAADTSEASLQLHKDYTQYIIDLQKKRLVNYLRLDRDIKLKDLDIKKALMTEDAKISIERERRAATYSMNVARAAKIEKPIANYNGSDRFTASLGIGALTEQAKILESMTLEQYQPKLVDLNKAIKRLQKIDLTKMEFRPFTYLNSPDEPFTRDKPKRALIVVLATLLGGMLGVGIVLARFAFRDTRISP